jgi:outer membrane protein TolC
MASLLVLFLCPIASPETAAPPAPAEPAGKTNGSPTAAEPAAAPAASVTAPQINLPLMSAVAMAIGKNIDLRVEALNSSMSEADAARSRGIYNPIFNASATGGESVTTGTPLFKIKSGTASIGLTQYLSTGGSIAASHQTGYTNFESEFLTTATNDWQSSVGLTITQPLLKNAGKETMELSITLSANTLQDSLERFRSTTTDTVSSVITSYNHLYALRQVLESRVTGLTSSQKLLDEINKKEKPGSLHVMEIANAEFAIAQRRKDLVDAERNVRDQEASLRYLIGMESKLRIIPIDSPSQDEPEETEVQSVSAAVAIRSDLKQLYIALKTGQLQERVARHQALPDLSITASGGFTGTGVNNGESYRQLVDHPATFWSAGMQFNVPIGNTAAKNDYLKSKIRVEQLQNQIKALEWKIRNDVEADLRALISARLQRQTADRSRQLAEQRLEEYRKNNLLGTATVQDVINAENDLTSARNSQMDAIETFANAVTKLWRDTGELLDRQKIQIDTSHPEKLTEEKQTSPVNAAKFDAPISIAAEKSTSQAKEGEKKEARIFAVENPAARNVEIARVAGKADKATKTVTYTLKIGEYVMKVAMLDAKRKIKNAGLSPVVKQGPKRKEPMTNLYIGEFSDQESARKELNTLRNAKADGFISKNGERSFHVYAGSYFEQKGAAKEQQRLAALGIKLSLKQVVVSVPTFLLTAGSFPTREAALEKGAELEKEGLKSVVIENDIVKEHG